MNSNFYNKIKASLISGNKTNANYAYTYPTGPHVTTPGTGTIPNSPNTGNGTYVTTTTSPGLGDLPLWNTWTKEEKKCLTKVGFKYDPDKGVWRLSLTSTVELPQEVGLGVMGYIEGKTCVDHAITLIKDAKDNLIKKLKAKAVLLELTRPKKIKE